MKKQWFTRALAYMVVVVMVFALASCSGGDKTPTQGGTASDKPEQSKSPDSSAPSEEELPFVTMDWYLGLTPMPDNQMVNDAVNEYLKEKVNANVNIHYWDAKDWETKMTTMISAGRMLVSSASAASPNWTM
jgi:putative aldouronate transport system substrate-binding protein